MRAASAFGAPQYKINGKIFTGAENITAKVLSAGLSFESHLPGAKGALIGIACKDLGAPGGEILENNKTQASELILTLCSVTQPAGCKVVGGKLKTIAAVGTIEETGTDLYLQTTPSPPPTFSKFELEGGACEGIFPLSGSMRCLALTNLEEILKGCTFTNTTGSNLKFGNGEPKSLTLTGLVGLELTGSHTGESWGVNKAAAIQYKVEDRNFIGSESITPKITSTAMVLETHLPGMSGAALVTSCKDLVAPGGEIRENNKSNANELLFILCTVTQPAGCKVKGGVMKSGAIANQLEGSISKLYLIISPATGANFATLTLEGGACEGVFAITGTARCLVSTIVEEVRKGCEFRNTTGGTIKFGSEEKSATLTGEVSFELTGTNKGKVWGVG